MMLIGFIPIVACGTGVEDEQPGVTSNSISEDEQEGPDSTNQVSKPIRQQGVSGIRGVRWGMSKTEVKTIENGAVIQERAHVIDYRDIIRGDDQVELRYEFDENGRLTAVVCRFQWDDRRRPTWKYQVISWVLREKYGIPDQEGREADGGNYEIWYKDKTIIAHTESKSRIDMRTLSHYVIYEEKQSTISESVGEFSEKGKL